MAVVQQGQGSEPREAGPRADAVLGLTAHGFHRIRYWEWGDAGCGDVLVCVHGLTRNGRDFDTLAARMADRRRVLCPDVPGRGDSDWLDPGDYTYPQYAADMAVLIARSGAETVDWVGTSMGGIFGMILAAPARTPIRRLVLNDVGPFIPKSALDGIAETVAEEPHFASLEAAANYIARVNAGFGPLSPGQWLDLARSSVKARDGGGYAWKRDPALGKAFVTQPRADVVLWPIWDMIRCPVLVLRGADSLLLTAETAEEMTRRGPKARLVTIPGTGHAPALLSEAEIAPIRSFLAET